MVECTSGNPLHDNLGTGHMSWDTRGASGGLSIDLLLRTATNYALDKLGFYNNEGKGTNVIIDLTNPTQESFRPGYLANALMALKEDQLYMRGADGIYHVEMRESYFHFCMTLAEGGKRGMYETREGYAMYMGSVTALFGIMLTEAKLADRMVDEDDLPFGDNHEDTPPVEAPPLTEAEIEAMIAGIDDEWAANSTDNPDAPF